MQIKLYLISFFPFLQLVAYAQKDMFFLKSGNTHVLAAINKNAQESRLQVDLEGGVLLGGNDADYPDPRIAFSVLTYYVLEPWAELGVSVVFENYFRFRCVPFLLYYKTDLDRRYGAAFAYATLGYSKVWQRGEAELQYEKINGGVAVKLGVGHAFKIVSRPMDVPLAYSLQNVMEVYPGA